VSIPVGNTPADQPKAHPTGAPFIKGVRDAQDVLMPALRQEVASLAGPEAGGFVTPEQPTGWFYTCRQPETICPCMVLQCFTTPDESSRPPEQHYTKLTDKTVDKCTQYERMASHREAAICTFVQRLA